MKVAVNCPHCQQEMNAVADVETLCPHCHGRVLACAPEQRKRQGTPRWQIALACVLLLVLLGMSQLGGGRRPASAPTTVYPSSVPAAAPVGPIWIKRGQEVYTRLQNEGRTNRMATVDFKSAGIQCSLVLVKGTWQTLTSADQDSLAALLSDYAQGRPWRLFDGGSVMRSSAGM